METIQAPPGVNIPAVLLPLLQAMAQTDTTFPSSNSDFFVDGKINFGVSYGWFRVQVLAAANDAPRRVKWVGPMT